MIRTEAQLQRRVAQLCNAYASFPCEATMERYIAARHELEMFREQHGLNDD